MNKLIQALLLVIIGLAVLASASRLLAGLIHAAVPLICVAAIAATLLRIVWTVTRNW